MVVVFLSQTHFTLCNTSVIIPIAYEKESRSCNPTFSELTATNLDARGL